MYVWNHLSFFCHSCFRNESDFSCCFCSLKQKAIADVEKVVIESLEKQYADVLTPLKDCIAPKKFGLKVVQKLTKRNSMVPYSVPEDVSFVSNSRLMEILGI
jgi:hypothetical protein